MAVEGSQSQAVVETGLILEIGHNGCIFCDGDPNQCPSRQEAAEISFMSLPVLIKVVRKVEVDTFYSTIYKSKCCRVP